MKFGSQELPVTSSTTTPNRSSTATTVKSSAPSNVETTGTHRTLPAGMLSIVGKDGKRLTLQQLRSTYCGENENPGNECSLATKAVTMISQYAAAERHTGIDDDQAYRQRNIARRRFAIPPRGTVRGSSPSKGRAVAYRGNVGIAMRQLFRPGGQPPHSRLPGRGGMAVSGIRATAPSGTVFRQLMSSGNSPQTRPLPPHLAVVKSSNQLTGTKPPPVTTYGGLKDSLHTHAGYKKPSQPPVVLPKNLAWKVAEESTSASVTSSTSELLSAFLNREGVTIIPTAAASKPQNVAKSSAAVSMSPLLPVVSSFHAPERRPEQEEGEEIVEEKDGEEKEDFEAELGLLGKEGSSSVLVKCCNKCGAGGFSDKADLKKHRKTCGKRFQYFCKLCPEKFKTGPRLVKHLRAMHNEEKKEEDSASSSGSQNEVATASSTSSSSTPAITTSTIAVSSFISVNEEETDPNGSNSAD